MILGGSRSSKNAIPLPLGAASLLLATQHTCLKKSIFFLFLGNLACLVRTGFYNGLWRGRQCVGVVTRSRAYINLSKKYITDHYSVHSSFTVKKFSFACDWIIARSHQDLTGSKPPNQQLLMNHDLVCLDSPK